jgi:hypothetical protein
MDVFIKKQILNSKNYIKIGRIMKIVKTTWNPMLILRYFQ